MRIFRSRLLLPWMIAWLVVFPLFHIHPEADHAHGATHHTHGGTFHSVFSRDLPCESSHAPPGSSDHHNRHLHVSRIHNSHTHVVAHPEFNFSLHTRATVLNYPDPYDGVHTTPPTPALLHALAIVNLCHDSVPQSQSPSLGYYPRPPPQHA